MVEVRQLKHLVSVNKKVNINRRSVQDMNSSIPK